MVTIDNKKIDEMAADQRFVAAFPFLRSRKLEKDAQKSCSKCGRRNKLLGGKEHYARTMRDFAMLNASKITLLKQLLGTDKVQVFYLNDQKKIVRATF